MRANRTKIDTHRGVFSSARRYCGEAAAELGWRENRRLMLRLPEEQLDALVSARVLSAERFGRRRAVAVVYVDEMSRALLCTIGFEVDYLPLDGWLLLEDDLVQGAELGRTESEGAEVTGGEVASEAEVADTPPLAAIWEVIINELQVLPTGSPYELADIILGAPESSFAGVYEVCWEQLRDQYPVINFYALDLLVAQDSALQFDVGDEWRAMSTAVLHAGRTDESWMSEETVNALRELITSGSSEIPFHSLARSFLDLDPRSLFMALYRCLEATYSFHPMAELRDRLGMEHDWQEVARALADVLKWRPQEEDSLAKMLNLAEENLVRDLGAALQADLREASNPGKTVAKKLYALRNAIVHHRPGLSTDDQAVDDWDEVCSTLSRVVERVSVAVYDERNADSGGE